MNWNYFLLGTAVGFLGYLLSRPRYISAIEYDDVFVIESDARLDDLVAQLTEALNARRYQL